MAAFAKRWRRSEGDHVRLLAGPPIRPSHGITSERCGRFGTLTGYKLASHKPNLGPNAEIESMAERLNPRARKTRDPEIIDPRFQNAVSVHARCRHCCSALHSTRSAAAPRHRSLLYPRASD